MIDPGCTIRKPQIGFSMEYRGSSVLLAIAEIIIDEPFQRRISCIQPQIHLCQHPFRIKLAIDGTCGSCHIPLDIDFVSGTCHGIALGIQLHIHIDATIFGTDRAVAFRIVFFIYDDLAAAIDRDAGISDIGEESIAFAAQIDISIDDDLAAMLTASIRSRRIYTGYAIIRCRLLTIHIGLEIPIDGQVCIATSTYADRFAVRIFRCYIHISIDGQLAARAYLSAIEVDGGKMTAVSSDFSRNVRFQCSNSNGGRLRCTSLIISYILEESIGRCIPFCRCSQAQLYPLGIDGKAFLNIDGFGIPFRDFRNADSRIFGKCVTAIISDVVFVLAVIFTISRQCRGESSLFQQLATGAFAIFIKSNVSCFQCIAGCRQAFCDLHIAGQDILAACIRAVGQLASQCIQDTQNAFLIAHRHIVIPSDEGDLGTGSCLIDDGVTRFVVLSRFAISFMCVVDIRISAVVVDGQAIGILLEDVTRFL